MCAIHPSYQYKFYKYVCIYTYIKRVKNNACVCMYIYTYLHAHTHHFSPREHLAVKTLTSIPQVESIRWD